MEYKIDSLTFKFPDEYSVIKYDDQSKSLKMFQDKFQMPCECVQCPSHSCSKKCKDYSSCNHQKTKTGMKAVDIIAYKENTLNIIESKDYRKYPEYHTEKPIPPVEHIAMEVAKKFRDTLFCVWCGSVCDSEASSIRTFLENCRTKASITFFFHFESPTIPYRSGLYRADKAVPLQIMSDAIKKIMGPMADKVFISDIDFINSGKSSCDWTVEEK